MDTDRFIGYKAGGWCSILTADGNCAGCNHHKVTGRGWVYGSRDAWRPSHIDLHLPCWSPKLVKEMGWPDCYARWAISRRIASGWKWTQNIQTWCRPGKCHIICIQDGWVIERQASDLEGNWFYHHDNNACNYLHTDTKSLLCCVRELKLIWKGVAILLGFDTVIDIHSILWQLESTIGNYMCPNIACLCCIVLLCCWIRYLTPITNLYCCLQTSFIVNHVGKQTVTRLLKQLL